ncbi:hypothetical protein UlMin_006675 [Ulmus minor]
MLNSQISFPSCKSIWQPYIPPSHFTLLWCLWYNRLPIEDNLCKMGFHIASCCCLCGSSSENATHLFLECSFVAALWKVVFDVFKHSMHPFLVCKSFFLAAFYLNFISQTGPVWIAAIHAVIWTVWKTRNNIIFYNQDASYKTSLIFIWWAIKEANMC